MHFKKFIPKYLNNALGFFINSKEMLTTLAINAILMLHLDVFDCAPKIMGKNAHYQKYLIITIVISSLFQTEYSCHQTPFFNSLGGQSSSGSRYDNESRIYEEVFLTSNQEGRAKHTFYGKLHLIHESQNVILDTT